VGWFAVVGDAHRLADGRVLPRGALVRYREWYGASRPNVGLKLTAEEVADGIRIREAGDPKLAYGVLDPAAFAQDGGPSIGERMAKRGVYFRPADNKRVATRGSLGGWDQLRSRLKGNGDQPMIYFFDTCRDAIRTLPALQHDPDKMEDVDTEGEDHAPDEIRYACMSRPFARTIEKDAGPAPMLQVGPGNQVTLDMLWEALDRQAPNTRI
jgi:hypothetical protein